MTADEAKSFGERLLKDLAGLPERRMKTAVLAERLGGLGDEALVEALNTLIEKAAHAPGDALGVVLSIIEGEAFAKRMGYRRIAAIYRIAMGAGYADTARLFLRGAPKKPVGELRPAVRFPEVEGKTLGERKNLARRAKWQLASRLLYDTNPEVIGNLLLNPRIRESEIVKVAARRPNSPEILRLIAENRRWSTRAQVRSALVYNPHTPINISLALATFLGRADLLAVAADGLLHPWLRERAKRLAEKRAPRRHAGTAGAVTMSNPDTDPVQPPSEEPEGDANLGEDGGGEKP